MRSAKLTIFEGPDGGGKTTIAKEYAKQTGARYVHFPALPRINQSLGRVYVEAMLPALLGYQDVVMDRSWLSETPYGEVFREGRDRLTQAGRRMLERLAFRCGAVVVNCLPGASVALANFEARKGLELLKTRFQHQAVYQLYEAMRSELPIAVYDYTRNPEPTSEVAQVLARNLEPLRTPCHPLGLQSAGAWDAEVVLVGEGFAERKEWDSFYQWPFASFSGEGCSRWLTDQLHAAKVREMELLWVNADQPLDLLDIKPSTTVVALGTEAASACYTSKIEAKVVEHPQYWKRFRSSERYRLINILENLP